MMTIKQIYELAIKLGIKADPRSGERVKLLLKREKEKFDKMEAKQKALYDQERLVNPFSDTRVLFGEPNQKVKRALAGVDIETGEVMLAKSLSDKKPIDLIIGHHPHGQAFAGLDDVIRLQADLLGQLGIPINIAESLVEKRVDEVARGVSPVNHFKSVDAARLMNLPFMCVHTAADNLVFDFLKKAVAKAKNKLETVADLMELLLTIPEYQTAAKQGAGPKLFAGKKDRRLGKIAVSEVTGGTECTKDIYEWLAKAGIGTVVGMHMKEENRQEAEKYHINVIIAGHMSSDSLGLNLFFDELEKRGVEIVPCSGLIRVKRFKKGK